MNIEFLLDENLPFALIDFLEQTGYSVNHLKKMGKSGIKNGEIYKIAQQSKSWIITRDADFENYYRFKNYTVEGIILIKLSVTNVRSCNTFEFVRALNFRTKWNLP